MLLLEEAARLARSQGEQLVEVRVRHAAIRLGDRAAARQLTRVASAVEGPFASAAGLQAHALLDGDVAAFVGAAESFNAQGALAEAADAFAQAARALGREGDKARSRELASRAAGIARAVGGLDTPLLRAVVLKSPLTRRQHDVARLAASGLSNREIAEQLGVGIRTIESHLETAYRRVGVASRAELAAVLAAEDLP
jgi:DNA-binding CsgD family transcriptional regulator